jgi:SOS-response transcriptional repressor LexA
MFEMKKYNTADRLKHIIEKRKLRQVDILEKCKPYCEKYNIRLERNDLSQYVSGKVTPGQEKLTIMAKALNVSESWLMGYDVSTYEDVSLNNIILDRTKDIGLSLENIAKSAEVPLYWLQKIDDFIPGEFGDDEIGYEWITRVAEKLELPPSMLRTALARQEIPVYDGPATSAVDDFTELRSIEMRVSDDLAKIENKTSLPPGAFPPPHKKRIPILGRIAAGVPITAVENIEGYEWVDDESIDYGLVVKGDSMIPLIREDSAIYVAKDLPVENGDVVVALVDGLDGADATVKRYYKWGNQVILKPENPSYKEQEYSAKDVRIVGKVKEIRIKL